MLSSWSKNTATHCSRGKTQVALQLRFTRNALQVKGTGLCGPFKAYFLSQELLIHVPRNAFLMYPPCTGIFPDSREVQAGLLLRGVCIAAWCRDMERGRQELLQGPRELMPCLPALCHTTCLPSLTILCTCAVCH